MGERSFRLGVKKRRLAEATEWLGPQTISWTGSMETSPALLGYCHEARIVLMLDLVAELSCFEGAFNLAVGFVIHYRACTNLFRASWVTSPNIRIAFCFSPLVLTGLDLAMGELRIPLKMELERGCGGSWNSIYGSFIFPSWGRWEKWIRVPDSPPPPKPP